MVDIDDIISRLESGETGSKMDSKIFEALNEEPVKPEGLNHGKALTVEYARDLDVCDSCGKPATEIRDLSLQLPDYYGYCKACAALSDSYEKESNNYRYARYDAPSYTTSIDGAITLVPDGFGYSISKNDFTALPYAKAYGVTYSADISKITQANDEPKLKNEVYVSCSCNSAPAALTVACLKMLKETS